MTYGFHDDLTKAWVGEIYPLAVTLTFNNQTTKTVTMDIPNGWTAAEVIVASIGIGQSQGGSNFVEIYGDLEGGSIYPNMQRRVTLTQPDNKIAITLRNSTALTGSIPVTVLLVRT